MGSCQRPGCPGSYEDMGGGELYCGECGLAPVVSPRGLLASPPTGAVGGGRGSGPSSGRGSGSARSSGPSSKGSMPSAGSGGPAGSVGAAGSVGSAGSAGSRSSASRSASSRRSVSGRLSRTASGRSTRSVSVRGSASAGTGQGRKRLGAGLVTLPDVPRPDPRTAVLENPEVPERKRFCSRADCGAPVGRARGGRPGRTEGFCTKCGHPYSFVPKLRAGDVVNGQYEVAGCLAHGGLGWIYLAVDHAVADRWVVLKGLLDTGDEDALAAALAERRFLAEIEHAKIVRIYNFVEHLDQRTGSLDGYIVMEYVGGKSLKEIANERRGPDGRRDPLPVDQACAYGLEALEALGHLHSRNLLYCDFKVDNAIQQQDQLKLIDMGAVRRADDKESAIYGTVGYQAPEVAETGPTVASDLYTVGRTLAVLTFDFQGYTTVFADSLPDPDHIEVFRRYESFYRFLVRATDPDPDRRFSSAEEMAEQLTGVLREVVALRSGQPRPALSTLFGAELRVTDTRLFADAAGRVSVLGPRPPAPRRFARRRGAAGAVGAAGAPGAVPSPPAVPPAGGRTSGTSPPGGSYAPPGGPGTIPGGARTGPSTAGMAGVPATGAAELPPGAPGGAYSPAGGPGTAPGSAGASPSPAGTPGISAAGAAGGPPGAPGGPHGPARSPGAAPGSGGTGPTTAGTAVGAAGLPSGPPGVPHGPAGGPGGAGAGPPTAGTPEAPATRPAGAPPGSPILPGPPGTSSAPGVPYGPAGGHGTAPGGGGAGLPTAGTTGLPPSPLGGALGPAGGPGAASGSGGAIPSTAVTALGAAEVPAPGAAEAPAVGTGAGPTTGTGEATGTGCGAGRVIAPLNARAAALALPVPRVDPTDPSAGFLAGLLASAPQELIAALRAAPADSPELRLRELRARLELDETETAAGVLRTLEAGHPEDWRVVWYRGVTALVTGDHETAALSFDALYDAFPGEPAPKLALGICAEVLGQLDNAAEYYHLVWATDPGYVSAAFGLARVRLATGDRAGAVRALESVPEASIHYTAARVAAVRARLRGRSATEPLLDDLVAAAQQVERLREFGLDAVLREHLTTEVLGCALDWVLSGERGTTPVGPGPLPTLLDAELDERALRFGLERAYRVLARLAQRGEERIELVERANRLRPRTWV
ncbi:tetratricopeptide repeat protein [Streptomyces sp. URMC 123]|uniref:serine/threonine-protein kinase n=1 Tax=Streptomyces sp. URMC 123 TaxID=3423403 RepID=UPI003F1B51F9